MQRITTAGDMILGVLTAGVTMVGATTGVIHTVQVDGTMVGVIAGLVVSTMETATLVTIHMVAERRTMVHVAIAQHLVRLKG